VKLSLDKNFHAHLIYIPSGDLPSKEEIAHAFGISPFEVVLPESLAVKDLRDFLPIPFL